MGSSGSARRRPRVSALFAACGARFCRSRSSNCSRMLVNVCDLVGRHSLSRCTHTKIKQEDGRKETKLISSPHINSHALFQHLHRHAAFVPRSRQEKRKKREIRLFCLSTHEHGFSSSIGTVTLHSYQNQ